MGRPPDKPLIAKVFAALGSYWLAITVLAFLFLLVVIGTLEQTRSSLFEVQSRYFDAAFVFHDVLGVPVPLPGVYLLLVVLGVNLIVGGIVRIRKDASTAGVLVVHLGILTMLVGAAIESSFSQKGHATVAEGATTQEFTSYYEWEIAIAEARDAGAVEEHVIPGSKFMHVRRGASATFTSDSLPFDLVVHDVSPSCAPGSPGDGAGPAVDGVALVDVPRHKEAEQDLAGAYVTVVPKQGGATTEGILWAGESYPLSVEVAGARWTIDFSHRRWQMPFAVRLDEFHQEMHPGTGMAKSFESDVTKIQGGVDQRVKISMNKPLRQQGLTLFQSGFQQPDRPGGVWWSTFSVVRNPADDVPLWSCIVIAAGLLLHFTRKLVRHVRSENGRQA